MRLAIALLIVAGCGTTQPPSSVLSPSPLVAPSASAMSTAWAIAGSPPTVRVDQGLLDALPPEVDGVAAQPDPGTAAEVAGNAALQAQVDAIAIAIYVAPDASGSTGDYAVATVVHLRPGVFSDTFYRDWRDTFDAGVCEQAGGVSTRAETTIAERRVFIGTCVDGVRTYHVHLADDDVLVSIQALGEGRLGERIVAGLTE